jgi:gamma-glutamylcyclotransferase (GGCT)/AIG2-like uncharacterized protein YtfP
VSEDRALPLFVYGTLRAGGPAAGLLAGLRRWPARCPGILYALPAGYPALQPSTSGWVDGELLAPPDLRRLALLDRYEGVDEGLYRRAEMRVECEGRRVNAWVYVMDDPRVHGGTTRRAR